VKVKIRKGDKVFVVSGNDKGESGEVIKVLPSERRVVVHGLNLRKKHQRQMQSQGQTVSPGIVEFEAPMHISNVMLECPNCKEPSRVRIERDEAGKAQRICKRCGALVDE